MGHGSIFILLVQHQPKLKIYNAIVNTPTIRLTSLISVPLNGVHCISMATHGKRTRHTQNLYLCTLPVLIFLFFSLSRFCHRFHRFVICYYKLSIFIARCLLSLSRRSIYLFISPHFPPGYVDRAYDKRTLSSLFFLFIGSCMVYVD